MDVRTKCQNAECGTALKFGVNKYGRVSLNCPKCKMKQAFNIEQNADAGPSGISVAALGLIKTDAQPQQPQPAPQPTPQQPQPQQPQAQPQQPQPQNEIKELGEEIIVGKEMMVVCPHCGGQLKVKVPKEGSGKMQCGKCMGQISFKAVSKTVINFVQKPSHTKRGRLVKVNGFLRKNEVFKLRDGKNVIGRFDQQCQSDIAISGDGLMSRRSVEIEVKSVMGGYTFKFTILKSTNPVVYNKKEYRAPYSREINFGDTFVLGATTFRFEADD